MSGPPRSLMEEPAWALSRDETLALAQRVLGYMHAPDGSVAVQTMALSTTEFANNEVWRSRDTTVRTLQFIEIDGRRAVQEATDLLDAAALEAVVRNAEQLLREQTDGPPRGAPDPLRPAGAVSPALWTASGASLNDARVRLAAVQNAIRTITSAGMTAFGEVRVVPTTLGVLTKDGHFEYGRSTTCRLSVTARTKDGAGSGWAAWTGNDWSRADPVAIATRASTMAKWTQHPVAVEPGRWTVVMAPEAFGELMRVLIAEAMSGRAAEEGASPFSDPARKTKLDVQVVDRRITVSVDPMDSLGGFIPFAYDGRLVQYIPATWIEQGVLRTLSYETFAEANRHAIPQVNNSLAFRVDGGATTVEAMIAGTARGIYVTRFSNVAVMDQRTMLMSGFTRDGTVLIENGRLTKGVKNMRFLDSPLFFLNNLDAIGPTHRVAVGEMPCVAPPVKVHDFAFTNAIDAV